MTEEETLRLKDLLVKVKKEERGWIPKQCLGEFFDLTVTAFFELVFYREREGRYEYLLAYRKDEHWDGFHVMGGMLQPGFPADPVGICQLLTNKEFGEHGGSLGVTVKSVRIISSLNWSWHPWCHPYATVCLVEWEGAITETALFRFFALDELPPMIPNHREYLFQCEQVLRTGKMLVFTPDAPLGKSE